jgi:NAD dependent epimerase/dehydratase family enzyme
LIEHDDIEGVVNIASPHPMPNAEFMRALRDAWGIRVGIPTERWMLEIGAVFLRTESELVLKSRRVVPRRLLEHGFVFTHPQWPEAARDLCRAWLIQRGRAARTPSRAQGQQPSTPHRATSR